jgi:uncharacterized protein (TIGR03435 family)
MKHREPAEDPLEAHLGLFSSPPAQDVMEDAEQRAFQRLREEAAAPVVTESAVPLRWDFRWALAGAAAVVAMMAVSIMWPRGAQTYTTSETGTQFTLADGSHVEMRAGSGLTIDNAKDGIHIRLERGGIIVEAAKQQHGHLYVETRDMTVAVVGTVFVVDTADEGSRVAVIEGEVRVRDGARETTLGSGQHVSTNPAVAPRPVKEEIAWSRQANAHVALLQQSVPQTSTQASPPPAASRPQFEEASIRPCVEDLPETGGRGGGPNSLVVTPGHFYMQCLTLSTIIRTAYGYGPMMLDRMNTSEDQRNRPARAMRFDTVYGLGTEDGLRVRGGAGWIHTERYSIEAVTDPSASPETMRESMLQELLERRFQVRVHVEAEQVPAHALTVAQAGLRIKPMQPGDCGGELTEEKRAERARLWDARGPVLITEAARLGIRPTCSSYSDWNGPNMRAEHSGVGLAAVAGLAGDAMGVRVIDRTGITDRFVFAWEFGPDETTPNYLRLVNSERSASRRPGFDGSMALPKAPPLLAALEQLGLKLEPIRLPREFIVIDRVERPGPN